MPRRDNFPEMFKNHLPDFLYNRDAQEIKGENGEILGQNVFSELKECRAKHQKEKSQSRRKPAVQAPNEGKQKITENQNAGKS